MFTATLLTDPAQPNLDANLPQALRNAWGGGEVLWLAPGEAAEFTMPALPGNRWSVWEELQKSGVDLIVQPGQERRKKMLIADMDSTMIEQECIDELADAAGIGAHVAEITARAMNGELDFEAALVERVHLLKGLEESIIARVLEERITYRAGGRALLATMKAAGAYTTLVSGGFTAFTTAVAHNLGFDEHRANRLVIENGRLSGEVVQPILGRAAKVTALEEISARLGLSDQDILAVGDGANDLGMLLRAGSGAALHAKPSVAAQCDIRINHGDLTALLYLQGYEKREFIGTHA